MKHKTNTAADGGELCAADVKHGALVVRMFIHPRWAGSVRAWRCPVCGRAWFLTLTGWSELNVQHWAELTNASL